MATPARLRPLLTLGAAVLLLLVFAGGASADKVITEIGGGPGQTLDPGGLAVDFETGRLYVADTGNNRIQVFDENGTFVKAFGSKGSSPGQFEGPRSIAVDNSASPSNGDVYVVDSGNGRIQKFGPEGEFKLAVGSKGTGEGQFNFDAGPVLVGVGPGGVVYVVDSLIAGSEFEYRLQKFDAGGVLISPQKILIKHKFNAQSLAVTATGDLYVSPGNGTIRKYEADGTAIGEIEDAFEEDQQVTVGGLAVDDDDNLFAASSETGAIVSVMEFDSAGNRMRRFGYGSVHWFLTGVAPDPSGQGVYISEASDGSAKSSRVLRVDFPPPGPLVLSKPCAADPIGNSKATLNAEVNPEGKATTYRFQYISEEDFEANIDALKDGFEGAASTPESAPLGSDFTRHKANAQVTGLIPETEYRCRAIATNADAPAGNPGPEGSFKTKEPLEILETQASEVGTETATLSTRINPLGISASGFFEYVDDAAFQSSGFATATKAPAGEPLDFGAGETPVLGSTSLAGLDPATTYHYRLVGTNVLISPQGKTVISPTRTFRTFSPTGLLPDDRAYELVSPAQKNSAEVGVPIPSGGLYNNEVSVRINAAATSGEAVTYTSWTSFGEAGGAPSASQYLSKRGPAGWSTENISPRGFIKNPLSVPYRGFTADLGFGAFFTDEPALTPEAQEGHQNLYLRDNLTGQIQALTIAAPQLLDSGLCTGYAGASADGSRAIFAANAALTGTDAIPGEGFSLYEWSAAGGLKLVSVLPDGEPAPPAKTKTGAGVGTGTGFGAVGGNCTMDQAPVRNAISEDGSVLFWTYPPPMTVAQTEPGKQTVTLGPTGGSEGTFTLSFKDKTTTPLPFGQSAAKVQTALASLSTVGFGNVEVSGTGPYAVTFKGALADTETLLGAEASAQLFARIDGTETIQLDAKGSGEKDGGSGRFRVATGDGSRAFFTAPAKLTADSKAAGQLYRYDTEARTRTNLTPGTVAPQIQGVIGASEDGEYVYFVGEGALTGEEENEAGQKATAEANNLYLWHEGEGLRFIAALSDLDSGSWDSSPERLKARLTPDGRHLAFLSIQSQKLSGYDNTRVSGEGCQPDFAIIGKLVGDPHCAQAYLYDAEADTLTCASCNPTGARPLGPTELPGWTNPYEGPRYLSFDGSRLFLESRDALSPADENNRRDVYEFERAGSGSCEIDGPGYDPASGGCLFLVSTGTDDDDSYLIDASADGRDVFLSTRSVLTGWDTDGNYDVYDARIGGGFPEPPPPPVPCSGEACPAPPSAPPVAPLAATQSFQGPGNAARKPVRKKQKQKSRGKKKHKGKAKTGKHSKTDKRKAGR